MVVRSPPQTCASCRTTESHAQSLTCTTARKGRPLCLRCGIKYVYSSNSQGMLLTQSQYPPSSPVSDAPQASRMSPVLPKRHPLQPTCLAPPAVPHPNIPDSAVYIHQLHSPELKLNQSQCQARSVHREPWDEEVVRQLPVGRRDRHGSERRLLCVQLIL
jgi:hypothetical protein